MKELKIQKVDDILSRIYCEGGKVLDTRNYRTYSEVVCKTEDIEKVLKYLKAV